MTETHTIDEAIERFDLISEPGSLDDGKACVMTAISWVTGEAWSDSPSCTHRVLRGLAIAANDADDTTPEQRAEILRAGETGLIDTWWIPIEVIAAAMSRPKPADGEELLGETMVEKCLRTLGAITWWKADKQRANLRGADLGGANLRSADLGGANLRGANLGSADLGSANLRGADLGGADLWGANLRSANLGVANLGSADLGSANLGSANLRGANLRGANLGSADLGSADLGSANLGGANLWGANLGGAHGNSVTVLPAGWHVEEATGLIARDAEVES